MCEMSMGKEAEMDALVESAGLEIKQWVAKDGQSIKYEDLTDSHLQNILRYLRHRSQDRWVKYKIEDLGMERDRREGKR